MRFKEWLNLQETGTSTGDVAGFARICMPMVYRWWPTEMDDEKNKKKKKTYRVPQVEECDGHSQEN